MTKIIVLSSIIVLSAASLIPYSTTLVPEWKLRVIDEKGNAYRGKLVREACYSYTLGIHPCYEAGDVMQNTDENGYVFFSEKKIRASMLSRALRTAYNFVMQIADGSFGERVYVDATGPQGYKTLKYIPGEPLPTEFVLP